jgi:hypothetical protein
MIDYIVKYETFNLNNIDIKETIITLEDQISDDEFLEDVLIENLKDYLETEDFEIIEYYTLTQTEQANLYRITADDVYYNDEYMYKGDIQDEVKDFVGKDMKEVLDIVKKYK